MSRIGRVAAVLGRSRAPSGNAGFQRLWIGNALSETGAQITTIAMPLLVLSLTGSAAQAGIVGGVIAIAAPLAALGGGVLVDRVDRRRLMIGCALGSFIASMSVVLALALGDATLVQLLLVAAVDATLGAVAYVAERSLLAELVPREQLPEAVTLNEARTAAAYVAGPPAGGALFGVARALPFVADAASFLAVIGALAGLRTPARPINRSPVAGGLRALRSELREGFQWLWRQPFLRAGSLLYAALNVSLRAVELLALLIMRRHGASPAAIGGAYAIVGAGGLVGAAIAGPLRRRVTVRWGILAEPWSYALLSPLLLVLHTPATVGPLLAVMLLPLTLSSSIVVGTRLALAPDHLRGRVQASSSFLAGSVSWLGPLLMGLLAQYASEDLAVIALTGICLATAVLATVTRAFREQPASSAPTAPSSPPRNPSSAP